MKKVLLFALSIGAFFTAKAQPANDACSGAININDAFAGAPATFIQSGPYNNTDGTGGDVDLAGLTGCWQDDATGAGDGTVAPQADATVWFTFAGTGLDYYVVAAYCDTTIAFDTGDTQIAIYSGSCGNLTLVACNEDIDLANGIYWAATNLSTVEGTTYYLVVDGFNYEGFGSTAGPLATGEFCLQVAQGTVGVDNLKPAPAFAVFPNPAHDNFTINGKEKMSSVVVRNMVGEIVYGSYNMNTNSFRIEQQFAAGMYLVDVTTNSGTSTTKLVIE